MKSLRLALAGALCVMMLTGCGADENHENTTATHTPEATAGATHKNNDNSMGEDAGNIIDDAGDAVDNAGKAVGDTVKDVGNAMKR